MVPVISGWVLWDKGMGSSVEAEGFCYIYVEIREGYDG